MILLFRSCFLTLESFEKLIRKKSKSLVGGWNARHVWNCRGMPAMPHTQTKREHFPPSPASCPTPSDPPNARAVIARRTYRRSPNLQRSFHSCLWLLCCTVHHPISGFLWQSTCYFFDIAPNILPCTYRLIF